MEGMSSNATLNVAIRSHETTTDWPHRETATICHHFFDIFNEAFFGGTLPACFLQFGSTGAASLGHYRPGLNAVAAQHEINLNLRHLNRPLYATLGTLLHEMTHQWQELHGQPGRGKYHNQEFTRKCESLGIPCTGGYRSFTTGYTNPFVSLLGEHGVEVGGVVKVAPAKGGSKLKKWSCGCTNVRVAVELHATCDRCGGRFERSE